MKKRVGPLTNAHRVILCCGQARETYNNIGCFHCGSGSLDRISDVSKMSGMEYASKSSKVSTMEKILISGDVCLIQHSPFRILRIAEQGNVKEFTRLITSDPSKLNLRDSKGRASVHQATIRNHVSILEVVVAFNGNLDLKDHHGNSCLHLAVETEALEALEFLLANGANSSCLNDRMQSPLHLAAELNKTSALKVIAKFRKIVDPNVPGEHGRTALHLAAINDHEECMRILLYEVGACPRRPCKHGFFPIHEAAKHASSRSMEILLTWGETEGNCPREEMISFFDAEGNVPLHSGRAIEIQMNLRWNGMHSGGLIRWVLQKSFYESAVHGGDIKAVELCLRSGAKISTQQHDLSTPVHLACSQGSMEIVKLMFQLQPEQKELCLKSCDVQRKTALHYASMFDHHALVEFLIEQGASINALDKERRTPLHLAASRNGWKTVKTLIRMGAKMDLKDNDLRNVLHTIVINGGDLDKILDEEFSGDFASLLEEKDKNGQTPLHYAARLGHIKTAARLLILGSSIITKNNDGENFFHIACKYGRLNIIHRILKMEQSNSVINEGDGRGLTALHIAASEGHVRVVQALIKKGALLHRDHIGNTPLHYASSKGQRETMKLILNVHSHLLDQTDKDGNTPLHVAAMENQPHAVELLLTMNCSLTYNFNGFSAMDFALHNKFVAVSLVMVTHCTRGDEILAMTAGKNPSIMLALIATMPQVVTAILDRCIIKSDDKSDSDNFHDKDKSSRRSPRVFPSLDISKLKIKYDFKWLELAVQEADLTGIARYKRRNTQTKFLPILNGMVSHGRVDLLSHDLSQKYLQMKWSGYGRFVHLTQLVLYLIFLAILTLFASNYSNDAHHPMTIDIHLPIPGRAWSSITNITEPESELKNLSDVNDPVAWRGEEKHSYTFLQSMQALVIFCIALLCLLRECVNTFHQRFKYALDSSNWVFCAMNVACVIMTSSNIFGCLEEWGKPSASLATFLSWFYLLLFLQRFDVVGIYVVMFLEILHTLLRVLMIFSILIVAFGLAFYILLSQGNHRAFNEIPISLMRTFSMMLGELDFINTFVNPHFCSNDEENGHSGYNGSSESCKPTDRRLKHPISSFLMLGIFMVLMPILLMNLLIGLAVGDIESVRRNAQLKRLAMQVHLHTALEKTLPKFILRTVDKKEMIEYPNQDKDRLGLIESFFKYFQPKSAQQVDADSADEELTDDLMSAVAHSNEALESVSTRLENLETLMRLLCHKMELCTDTDFIDEGTQVDDASPMSDMKTRFKRGVTIRLTKGTKRLPPQRSDSAA